MRLRAPISNRRIALATSLGAGLLAGSIRAESSLETIDREVSALYTRSQAAIVRVHAERTARDVNLPLAPGHRVGTGFFVDGEGRLLTADTIVEDAETCWVDYRGQRVPARVLGRDTRTNLALLEVDPAQCAGAGKQTPFLTLGDSENLRIGCMVVAIGFPYNLPSAPTVGFVTGFDIRQGPRVFPTSHVRASCRLSPGQGGSPLFNVRGEVIGVAVAAHADDQCHALPINAARRVYADIREHGAPQRGLVGVNVGERRTAEQTDSQWQVFVQGVFSNTPAATAGFHDGDILVRISTNEVHRIADVLDQVFFFRAGDRVNFTVLRNGQPVELALTVGTPPADVPVAKPRPAFLPAPQIVPAAGNR